MDFGLDCFPNRFTHRDHNDRLSTGSRQWTTNNSAGTNDSLSTAGYPNYFYLYKSNKQEIKVSTTFTVLKLVIGNTLLRRFPIIVPANKIGVNNNESFNA